MSQKVERSSQRDLLGLESGLEALRQSPDFRGPVEPLSNHEHSNDHFALLYESREDQFAAAMPFVRQGLEQNERCLYIADENSKREIIEAMRQRGIDVEAALESGALSLHTKQDTYLRNGTFHPDDMIEFLDDAIAEASEEYEALRVTGEMSWIFGDEPYVEDLIEYEAKLNTLLPDKNALALCQYNRERFPPDIIYDIVRTHPHLIHDNVVSHNVYYMPPEEFFGPSRPANEVNRMLGTLQERTKAKAELEDRQRFLRRQNEITSDPDRTFEEKLQALFRLGCDRFDLELGAMARVDPDDDEFEVEHVSDDHAHFEPGVELPLSETYCVTAAETKASASVSNPRAEGYDDTVVHGEFGLRSYLGTYIEVDGGTDRTFFFVSSDRCDDGFSDDELAFIGSMGQWIQHELEHRQRERFLCESHEITSNAELSFEEKLDQLMNLGCEWFDLEMAGLNHLPNWDGEFRLEKGVGLGIDPDEKPLWTDLSDGCFCGRTIRQDAPVSQADVRETDWADESVHRKLGLTSYLGTKVSSGSTPYGTLWFGSREPRERPFSDIMRTFIDLMGQWVSYEIEQREHKRSQRELYRITADSDLSFDEKVEKLLDLGRDQFGLDMGFFLEKQGDEFRVVKTRGTDLEEGVATLCAHPNQYCKRTITLDIPVGVKDAKAAGWDDDPLYKEHDLGCYIGKRVTNGDGVFGSICFASSSARKKEFTDAEFTFLDLMGQWMNHELERQQHEANLEKTIDQLRQSNGRLKQFAYAASHDLQEPLRMVSSYLQLLENQYRDELDEDAREYIDFAVDGADRMRAMVDDLLAYSRVEQSSGEFQPVDCDAILERVVNDLQVQVEENDAEVRFESLPTVMADNEQLEQLFRNLVSNGIKYSGEDPPTVEVTAERRSDRWELAVTDDGIGIDPEKTDRIFEVFKRLHHEDEYSGTGIGLSLCQEIVENHGGDIRVESEPGEGSTFFVTLPQQPTA